MRIVVVGGGAAGLFASLLLARADHEVVIFDQDRLEPATDVESAAAGAHRPSAPQIVQPHGIWPRCRELLQQRLPDVYGTLLAAGAVEVPISERMPASLADRRVLPGDERLTTLATRRSTLDWVLGGAVRAERGIDLRAGARIVGLRADGGDPRHVSGVLTDRGEVAADVVVDAAGRRSPIETWLREIGARAPAVWSAECGVAYFGRHYRLRAGAALPGPASIRMVEGFREFTLALFGADNGAMQLAVVPLATDRRFRRLRDPEAFEAVVAGVPAYAAWLGVLDPISPIFQMVAPPNRLRRLVVDGAPVVTGLHAIGDAVCTTNPTLGRGLSLAAWMGADLADTLDEHVDPTVQALVMDSLIADHVAPYYQDQAAADAARLAMLRHAVFGGPAPDPPATGPDRVTLAELRVAADSAPVAFRALWKLMGMLSPPDEVYADPEVVARTREASALGVPAVSDRCSAG